MALRRQGKDITAEYIDFVSVLLGSRDVKIEHDPESPTAACYPTYRVIITTDKLIPPDLRQHEEYRRIYMRGQLSHEQGHISLHPKIDEIREFLKWRVGSDKHGTLNIIGDAVINRQLTRRWQYSFGRELAAVISIAAEDWLHNLCGSPESKDQIAIEAAVLVGLYGEHFDEQTQRKAKSLMEQKCTKEVQEDANELATIIEKVKWTVLTEQLKQQAKRIFEILEKYNVNPLALAPYTLDGMQPPSNAGVEGQEKLDAASTEKIDKSDKDGKGKPPTSEGGKGYSTHPEEDISPPDQRPDVYRNLLDTTEAERERLRNQIVFTIPSKRKQHKYEEQGVFMPSALPRIVCGASRVPRARTCVRRIIPTEEYHILIIVDFSGSVNTNEAQLCLTILSDAVVYAAGENNVEILLFGDCLQKLKLFEESWADVSARIGGIQCLGGTTPDKAFKVGLEHLSQFFGKRVLFYIGDLQHNPQGIADTLYHSDAGHIALQIHSQAMAGVKELFHAHSTATWTTLPEAVVETLAALGTVEDSYVV